jgi:predicted nucleic acid-binding protein
MTTCLIIDAGIAIKLITPHPSQSLYIALVDQWQRIGYHLYAPTLWAYEVTSAFTKMRHFGQLGEEASQQGLHLAYQLGVQLVPPDEDLAKKAMLWTSRLQRAAAYDSFYLALAESLKCDLWTTDKRLVNGVSEPWVKLVEEET